MPGLSSRRGLAAAIVLAACIGIAASDGSAQKIRFIDTDPQQVGTAQPAQLGLPDTLWTGSSRKGLGKAFDSVDAASAVAAHRALTDMLKAAAALPAASAPGKTLDPPLIARRVTALARLGADSDALALAGRTPGQFRAAGVMAVEADIRLLRNDLAGACNLPTGNPQATATTEWQALRAFCSQAVGKPDAATVAAMLGSLSPKTADDTFAAMFLALQFPDRAKPTGIIPVTPLHVAMYRFLRLRPAGPEEVPGGPAPVLAGLSRNPGLSIELRTLAAERAVAANAGSSEDLAQLYLEGGGSAGTGAAYQKAAFAQDAKTKLAALQVLWREAHKAGLAAQLAPLTIGMASVGDPAAAPPDFIQAALRTALLAGDRRTIATWRDALATAALLPAGAKHRDASYPLLALAGERVPPAEQWWAAWLAAAKPTDAQQQLVGGMLGALGNAFALMPSPKISSKSAAGKIARLAKKAPGEAALRALAALPAHGKNGKADRAMQVTAVRLLAPIHQGHARALAVELAAASGL